MTQQTRMADPDILRRMNERQWHRGPDAGDYYFDRNVGLAHRRLSIIDLEGSPQPMISADERACIVFNGEIYNYRDLRQQLEAKGYGFNTRGDTETILNAYLEWGDECVQYLRGMFAFAIWDRQKRRLFMARDRLGIKPLFYGLLPTGELVFGSELKVLTGHPAFDRSLRHSAIEDYFTFGYVPEPHTIYQQCYKLPPGHTLAIENGQTTLPQAREYWDVPVDWQQPLTSAEVQSGLVDRLKQAVDIRLVADVPLGAFLSGGVDSSAIVALMSQLQTDPVNTCAIGFDVPQYNESEFAQKVADRYHTNHRLEQVDHNDFDLIDRLGDLYDEPYADSSALPTYRVCEMARKHVTVALSGDGGDELFAGYRRYKLHMAEEQVRARLPLSLRRAVFGPLGRLYPKLDRAPQWLRAKTTFQSMAMNTVQGYHNSISLLRADERARLFSDEFVESLDGYDSVQVFQRHGKRVEHLDPVKIAQYLDLKTYLVGDILTKVDRASMAHSLEVRVPILDHEFVEWAFRAPSDHNLRKGVGKYSFKKSLEPHLPDDVLYRKKMGFRVPMAEWLRGPLRERLRLSVLSPAMLHSGFFRQATLEQWIGEHEKGTHNHQAKLWPLMMFAEFLKKQAG